MLVNLLLLKFECFFYCLLYFINNRMIIINSINISIRDIDRLINNVVLLFLLFMLLFILDIVVKEGNGV